MRLLIFMCPNRLSKSGIWVTLNDSRGQIYQHYVIDDTVLIWLKCTRSCTISMIKKSPQGFWIHGILCRKKWQRLSIRVFKSRLVKIVEEPANEVQLQRRALPLIEGSGQRGQRPTSSIHRWWWWWYLRVLINQGQHLIQYSMRKISRPPPVEKIPA